LAEAKQPRSTAAAAGRPRRRRGLLSGELTLFAAKSILQPANGVLNFASSFVGLTVGFQLSVAGPATRVWRAAGECASTGISGCFRALIDRRLGAAAMVLVAALVLGMGL
jgi:hypothetical protein